MTDPADSSRLRAGASDGRPLRGLWVTFIDAFGLEVAAGTLSAGAYGGGHGVGAGPDASTAAPFDWLGVDLQHGNLDEQDLPSLLRAATVPVLARVASHEPGHLARVLDAGVAGIIVPGVESATEAADVVRAAYVPPRGRRSSGPSRSSLLGLTADPLVLAMVETATGLDHAAEIAATGGVDGIFVGPYDLSLSIGAESVTDPATLDAIAAAMADAREHDCLTGLFAGSRQLADHFGDADLVALDTDVAALRAGIRLLFDPDERN